MYNGTDGDIELAIVEWDGKEVWGALLSGKLPQGKDELLLAIAAGHGDGYSLAYLELGSQQPLEGTQVGRWLGSVSV